jgi:hypothetical protein
MQVPPIIPKATALPPQELRPEPVARTAPVVMADAAAKLDPSLLLKTPVPVSQGPRLPPNVRPSIDQTGPVYVSPEIPLDPEAAAHTARVTAQLGRAEAGPHMVKWPLPPELQQLQQRLPNLALASQPRDALNLLRLGLEKSPMLALSNFAESMGLVREKPPSRIVNRQQSDASGSDAHAWPQGSLPSGTSSAAHAAAEFLRHSPEKGSAELQAGLALLLHGQMQWQGQLTPGVQAKVLREDAYLEDPRHPGGPLAKGARITIEAELPTIGRVLVRGLQIGESVSISVVPQRQGQSALAQHFGELQQHLKDMALSSVQLRLHSEDGQDISATSPTHPVGLP